MTFSHLPPLYPYFPISIRDSLLVFPKKKTRSRINHKHLLLLCYIGAGNMTTYLCFIDSDSVLSSHCLLPVMIVGPLLRVQTRVGPAHIQKVVLNDPRRSQLGVGDPTEHFEAKQRSVASISQPLKFWPLCHECRFLRS